MPVSFHRLLALAAVVAIPVGAASAAPGPVQILLPGISPSDRAAAKEAAGPALARFVMTQERARLAGRPTPNAAPGAPSAFRNCPRVPRDVAIDSTSMITRDADNPSVPMSAQVNYFLTGRGCSLRSIVEVGVRFDAVPQGMAMTVLKYGVLAASGR